jgi:hypothetical protein
MLKYCKKLIDFFFVYLFILIKYLNEIFFMIQEIIRLLKISILIL